MISRVLPIPQTKALAGRLPLDAKRIVWVALISVAIILPAAILGMPSNRDLTNHFRFALPFYDALSSGHIYPGWLAESNSGYGDASFRFYPPALYYLLALTRTLTGSWYSGSLLGFTLLSLAGGLGSYLWARSILPASNAMWAAVFYCLAPYHINQFYEATMLAELAGSSLLPFCFLFVERICRRGRARDIAGLSISFALLVLTHLPLTVIGSLALLLYALLRLPEKQRWNTVLRLSLAVGLGLSASACYWTTMLAEKGFIRADNIRPDPSVDYQRNFVFSSFSADNLNVWWTNILAILTFLLLWPAGALFWSSARKAIDGRAIRSLAFLLLVAVLMATPLSLPVWKLIRPLQETQFPWRWLAIASMASCVLVGASCPFWFSIVRSRKRPLLLLAFAGVAISIAFSLSHTIREAQFLAARDFEATLRSIPGSASVTQWLPVWASDHTHEMQGKLDVPERSSSVDSWEPERRTFHVVAGKPTNARVRTFYYPYWTATAEGKRLPTLPAEDGALLISLPPQDVSVTLEFTEPKRVHVAAFVTTLGWLAILALFIPMRLGSPRVSVM